MVKPSPLNYHHILTFLHHIFPVSVLILVILEFTFVNPSDLFLTDWIIVSIIWMCVYLMRFMHKQWGLCYTSLVLVLFLISNVTLFDSYYLISFLAYISCKYMHLSGWWKQNVGFIFFILHCNVISVLKYCLYSLQCAESKKYLEQWLSSLQNGWRSVLLMIAHWLLLHCFCGCWIFWKNPSCLT